MLRIAKVLIVLTIGLAACSEEAAPPTGEGTGTTGTQGAGEGAPQPAAVSQATLVYESDFSSPEGGLFGGSPVFLSPSEDGAQSAGTYTDGGTLTLTATIPADHEYFEFTAGANTGGVFAGERELVDLSDVTVQVYATALEYEGGGAYGLHCRESATGPLYYEASINQDDYGKKSVGLLRRDGPDAFHDLGSAPLPPTAKVEPGDWNLLRMDCIGDKISFFLNGEEVLTATDSTYSSGLVALHATAYVPQEAGKVNPGALAKADFDNLQIHEY